MKAGVGEEVILQYILEKGIHHDAVISRDPSTIQSIKRRKQNEKTTNSIYTNVVNY
ncbi:hypothetical protein [Rossellomorea sp. BNER]|uniref:hypothetical protein n=1 Tax=Rossellomorea sp. BNER TaxID=2962031 RepID=UPI003AF317DA|nr:hypothetical protein [Rossellomorea sp. BNER]